MNYRCSERERNAHLLEMQELELAECETRLALARDASDLRAQVSLICRIRMLKDMIWKRRRATMG